MFGCLWGWGAGGQLDGVVFVNRFLIEGLRFPSMVV